MSEGIDTGERIDVGTGPGIDLDLVIPALAVVVLDFEYLALEISPDTAPALSGVTPGAAPPHPVTDPNATITVPFRCNNLIIDNPNVINSIFYTINGQGAGSCELMAEDVIAFDKRVINTLLIEGQAGDRVVIHAW